MIIFIVIASILAIFLLSAVIIHFRGKRKFRLIGQFYGKAEADRESDESRNPINLFITIFMAPANVLMYLFSKVPNKPYINQEEIPELQLFNDNWEMIREEALNLERSQTIAASNQSDDIGFKPFFNRGWKRFYIKWYSKNFHSSAVNKCPKTIELLKQTKSVKAAMFVVLPAGSTLPAHRDPYAGSLRYHLGLQTPNSDDCYINVDGENYAWRDGEAVLFDETYIHHAENNTDKDRLIFFCDIKRPMRNVIGTAFNSFFSWLLVASAKSPNDAEDETGNLNKAIKYLSQKLATSKA